MTRSEASSVRRPRPALRLPLLFAAAVAVAAASACGSENGATSGEAASVSEQVGADLLRSRDALSAADSAAAGGAPLSSRVPSDQQGLALNRPFGQPGEPGEAPTDIAALGYTAGREDAPLAIIEFSDFGCGYCRQFHLETYPTLHEEYVETGKVVWKYVPMVLGMFGRNADEAAVAGQCALEQDHFPPVREALFARQADWKRASDPRETLRGIVADAGVDVERWEACMESGRGHAEVVAGTRVSQQLGVRGTPTFIVLGEGVLPGALPLDIFRQALDELVARAEG